MSIRFASNIICDLNPKHSKFQENQGMHSHFLMVFACENRQKDKEIKPDCPDNQLHMNF